MANQYLSFVLNKSLYAFDVHQVQEVLVYEQPVKVPCSASYIEGLINSRNQGITVINMRKKFQLPDAVPDKKTRIIVLEIHKPTDENPDHISVFGTVADDVQEVLELGEQDIEPPPKFGNAISADFIHGIGKKDDKFIILLDIDKIFADCKTAE